MESTMIQTTFSFDESDEQITQMESLLEELSEMDGVEIVINTVGETTIVTATCEDSALLQKRLNRYSAYVTNRYTDLSRKNHAS